MQNEILKLAATKGIWTVLAVGLIFYILRAQEIRDVKQEKREIKYQNIIEKLTEKFNLVEDVNKNIIDIRERIIRGEGKI